MAHRAVLAGGSYTISAVRTTLGPERPVDRRTATVDGSTYAVRDGRNGTVLLYVDPTGRYARQFALDGERAGNGSGVTVSPPTPPPVDAGFRFLAAGDADVTRVRRDGDPLFRVYIDRGYSIRSLPGNYSVTAYVRPGGLVKTVVADAAGSGRSAGERFLERYTYAVGTVSVTEPSWVTRAKRNRTAGRADPAINPLRRGRWRGVR